jgi:O-antigen/teichoic acid export membrane protein
MLLVQIRKVGEYWSSILNIITGSLAAQLLIVIVIPVLARLYSPGEFGLFAVFVSLSTLFAVLVTGRYEAAIPLPSDKAEAWNLYLLALVFGALSSFGVFLILLFMQSASGFFPTILSAKLSSFFLLPLGIFGMVGINASEYWLNRNGDYRWVGANKLGNSAVMVIIQYFSVESSFATSGLILGFVFANCTVFFVSFLRAWTYREKAFVSWKSLGLKYVRFPQYLLIAQLLNTLASHMPILLLSIWFGSAFTGHYTMANRGLNVIDIASTATGQVFYPTASKQFAETGSCTESFFRTKRRLLQSSFLFFPVFFLVCPFVFSFFLGDQWQRAGEVARLLIPMYWVRYVVSPLSWMYYIRNRQDLFLRRQIFLVSGCFAGLSLGWIFSSPEVALISYSLSNILAYGFDYKTCQRFCIQ